MATKAVTVPSQTISSKHCDNYFKPATVSLSSSFIIRTLRHSNVSISHLIEKHLLKSRISHLSPKCSVSTPKPPTTREEAVLQAKTSLLSILEKPLNNPKLAGKLKKLKQPRFRIEVPVLDESPESLSELALEIFGNMPMKRKGTNSKILILWPSQNLAQAAMKAFSAHSSGIFVQNLELPSVLDEDIRIINSSDLAVCMAVEKSQLKFLKRVSDGFNPKPVVIFNPRWSFEEEINFGDMSGFAGSFEVVYSFTGLEVRGILSKRKGVIFKCVWNGVLTGEKWYVLVEEEDGELRVISRFSERPLIDEVENVLYNLMAINSPVTKSAKFLKDFVSNITGKK